MLHNKFPTFYNENGEMFQLFQVEDVEIQNINDKVESTFNQFFVNTADTSLGRWEKEVNLPTYPDKPIEERRESIKARLRGYGTVTIQHIKTVVDSFTNGNVVVTEKPATSEFEIKFNSIKGIPPNIEDVKAAIEQIKPAHLGVTYVYAYLTMGELSSYNMTMGEVSALNLTMAQWATYKR